MIEQAEHREKTADYIRDNWPADSINDAGLTKPQYIDMLCDQAEEIRRVISALGL